MKVNNIPMVHTLDFEQRNVEYMKDDYGNAANTQNMEVLASIIAEHRYLILLAEYDIEIRINGEECQRGFQRPSPNFWPNQKMIGKPINYKDVS